MGLFGISVLLSALSELLDMGSTESTATDRSDQATPLEILHLLPRLHVAVWLRLLLSARYQLFQKHTFTLWIRPARSVSSTSSMSRGSCERLTQIQIVHAHFLQAIPQLLLWIVRMIRDGPAPLRADEDILSVPSPLLERDTDRLLIFVLVRSVDVSEAFL
jgi:hypothetical protein